ncbi:MAG: domain lipoprotein, partial [Fibrobacteres bacterium]|nr:domain lipoprotein [Fibrobacterota bacterium]
MQRILSIGAAVFVLGTHSIPAADAKTAGEAKSADPKEACKQGRAQYASGDVLKAVKTLGRCVEHEPRNREAWVALANANLESGRFPQSAEAFAKAEGIKPGDEAFLTGYLSALEGAGMTEARIPVLRALAGRKHSDRKNLDMLLAEVESAGPDKYPEEYLFALQSLTEAPGADRYQVEKLAAAYLKRGQTEKAEAEYRGLLVRSPESGDDWAGLGSALAPSDPMAASECYRKASFYSNQADRRIAYQKEQQRLASAASAPKTAGKPEVSEDSKDKALVVAFPSKPEPVKEAPKAIAQAALSKPEPAKPAAPAQVVAQAAPVAPVASAVKPKPFDMKAFQDSIYKAELAKRMAAIHVDKAPAPAAAPSAAAPALAVAPSATVAAPTASAGTKQDAAKEKEAREAEAKTKDQKAKEEKAQQEKVAKEEKERQEALAKAAEKKATEEKEQQEKLAKEAEKKAKEAEKKAGEEKDRQEKLARESEKKAKEDKRKQDEIAAKQAEAEKSRLAVIAKAKEDSLKAEYDKKSKADREKQDLAVKIEKARTDSLARIADAKSKADKARSDSLARVAVAKSKADKAEKEKQEQLAKAEKLRQEQLAKAEKAKQDSLARVAEQKTRDEKALREQMAKAEKAKQDSLAKVAEQKAKAEKERQEQLARAEKARKDSLALAAELKAKAEKERLEKLAKAEKARKDSLDLVAAMKAKAEKARQDSLALVAAMKAKAEKARLDSLARVAELKAKEERAKQEALAKEAERKAKEERERIAREEERKRAEEAKARKLKEEQDHREKLARERRDRYDLAVMLTRDGRMDTALVLFKTVLADSPVADAFYHAGRANLAKGEFSKALDLFAKGPQDKPDLDGLKGKALMGMGKHKEALKALESQYAKGKDDSLLADLVDLNRKTGDEAGAIVYLEKIAEKHPGDAKVQEQLAVYYRAKGDKAKATEKYSRVFIVNPGHGEANYWLGMEAANSGDQARANPFLEKAVTVFPTRADAWKALAKCDAAVGRKDAAWEAYKKAFSLLPNDLDLAKGKLALARESHPGEAGKAFEDVLRIAPADADAALGLARLRYDEGNWAAAEKNFRIACKESKDSHAWALFGRSLLELKKTDEASVTLQKAIDLGDKDPNLHLDLARIRMDKGDLDWAEALVKDLAKKSPSDPEPLYYQGLIALKRQQTAVAEEFFRKSHQLKPEDGKYAEALGRLLRDKEDWKSAGSVLAQAESKLGITGRLLYGDCLARGGDHAKAQTVYAELYKKEATAALLSRRMDLLVRMGKAEQAVELAEGARAVKGPDGKPFQDATEVRFSLAKAQLALADAHVLKGDVDQAVDLMKQVLNTDDHKPEYHYYLGLGYYDQNRHKKALGEFVDALTYRVEYPEALYRKGLCLLKVEDVKEAENAFGELSQHADPIWKARGLYGLAMVFEAQGKPEAVQHHLERSILAN